MSCAGIIKRYYCFYKNKAIELKSRLKSRLKFRKFCPSKRLTYEIPKKARSSSFRTCLRYVYLSLLLTSSCSSLITAILLLLVSFRTNVILSSVKKLIHISTGSFSCALFCGLGCREIILAALHLPVETFEAVYLYSVLSLLLSNILWESEDQMDPN